MSLFFFQVFFNFIKVKLVLSTAGLYQDIMQVLVKQFDVFSPLNFVLRTQS